MAQVMMSGHKVLKQCLRLMAGRKLAQDNADCHMQHVDAAASS